MHKTYINSITIHADVPPSICDIETMVNHLMHHIYFVDFFATDDIKLCKNVARKYNIIALFKVQIVV